MHRRVALLLLGMLLLGLALSASAVSHAQTIPTRTPTPGAATQPPPPATQPPPPATQPPPPATQPPPPAATNPPAPDPTATPIPGDPQPTSTLPPATTAAPSGPAPTTPSGGTETPSGGSASCDVPPLAVALTPLNIRSGPGVAYSVVGSLDAQASHPIVGRYAFDEWWLVQVDATLQGWVADEFVQVVGYTALTPILTAPALNGVTPTPGPFWNPTPSPACACFTPPSLQPLFEPTNVRGGPGSDYEVIAIVTRRDMSLIIGRYAFGEWWQIQLEDGRSGWIVNSAVQVYGYTGLIPTVEPPLINGATPTPGPVWNPTPIPGCLVTATPTTTAAHQATPLPPTATLTPAAAAATPTATTATTAVPTAEGAATATVQPATTAAPLPTPTSPVVAPEGRNTNWLLIAGGALVVTGLAGFILTRNRGAAG